MGISISISLGENNYVDALNLCTRFLSCLSFLLVQVFYLSALFFSKFSLVGGTILSFSPSFRCFSLRFAGFRVPSFLFSFFRFFFGLFSLCVRRIGSISIWWIICCAFRFCFRFCWPSAFGGRKRTPMVIHKTRSEPFSSLAVSFPNHIARTARWLITGPQSVVAFQSGS